MYKTIELAKTEYSRRVKICYEHSISKSDLNNALTEVLDCYSKAKNLSFECLVCGTLCAISSLASNSKIKVTDDFRLSLGCLFIFSGYPSTNKSTCISLMRESYRKMENFLKLKTNTNNSITVESLIQEISKHKSVIQFWDEFNTFLDTMGLYNKSGGGFERSIINTLSNGSDEFKHDLKSKKYEIDNPRLCIFGAAHPLKIINYLTAEKTTSDGFISRYFIANPKPFNSILKVQKLNSYKNPIDLTMIFVICKIIHYEEREYQFDENAFDKIDEIVSFYDNIVIENEHNNSFVSVIFGKGKGHLLKICALLHIINLIFEILSVIKEPKLDENFELNVKELINIKAIDLETVNKAISLNEYFLNQKLILSGYDLNFNSVNELNSFDEPIEENESLIKIVTPKTSCKKSLNKIEKNILLYPGNMVFSTDLTVSKLCPDKSTFENVCKELEEQSLGKLVLAKRNNSHKPSIAFEKTDITNIDNNLKIKICNNLHKLKIDIDEFKNSFILNESKIKRQITSDDLNKKTQKKSAAYIEEETDSD